MIKWIAHIHLFLLLVCERKRAPLLTIEPENFVDSVWIKWVKWARWVTPVSWCSYYCMYDMNKKSCSCGGDGEVPRTGVKAYKNPSLLLCVQSLEQLPFSFSPTSGCTYYYWARRKSNLNCNTQHKARFPNDWISLHVAIFAFHFGHFNFIKKAW